MDLNNKTVLITGGTGSFGKSFTKFLLKNYSLKKLIVFSRDELKQYQMQQEIDDERIRFFIGDVRDLSRLQRAFRNVDIVIHAAALKQVPTLEYNPFEAIDTNINGTRNVVDACVDQNVKKAILISTDKAAYPANIYGATKLCAEKCFIAGNAYSGIDCRFAVVRYGNVLGSRGSIVDIISQKGKGDIVQLTDERMTRFWISLKDSMNLVVTAIKESIGGEIFVPKVSSMKVCDLLKALAPDCKIEIIGKRPGEKLHEVLLTEEESEHTLEFDDYYVILPEFIMSDRHKRDGLDTKKVEKDFQYRSDNNTEWLGREALIELIGDKGF